MAGPTRHDLMLADDANKDAELEEKRTVRKWDVRKWVWGLVVSFVQGVMVAVPAAVLGQWIASRASINKAPAPVMG